MRLQDLNWVHVEPHRHQVGVFLWKSENGKCNDNSDDDNNKI